MNIQALLEEAISSMTRTEEATSNIAGDGPCLGPQQDDLLLKTFYDVITRATSQLGFKKYVYAPAAQLIKTPLGVYQHALTPKSNTEMEITLPGGTLSYQKVKVDFEQHYIHD